LIFTVTKVLFFNVNRKKIGADGEKATAVFLKKHGYKILEKNYRTSFGEADLIVEKDGVLVFVEVKTRSSEAYGTPGEAVGRDKRERYVRIAEYYLSCHEKYSGYFVRFDVSEVLSGKINYIENAFDCND